MQRPERYAVTAEIVAAITSSRVLEEVLANVARRTAEALNVWECDIYEYHADDDIIVGQALWAREPHPADAEWLGSSQALADQPIHRRVLSEARMIASHIDDPELPAGDRAGMEWWGEKSCLLVPLIFQDEVIGCLELVEKRRIRRFSTRECEFAATLAALAAVAIQNARLHGSLELLATTDGLTGLYNHRYFYERLAQEVARAQRYEPAALAADDRHRRLQALQRPLRPSAPAMHCCARWPPSCSARRDGRSTSLPATVARSSPSSCRAPEKRGRRAPASACETRLPRAASRQRQDWMRRRPRSARLRQPGGGTEAARAVGERIRSSVEQETFGSGQRPPVVTVSVGVATMLDHAATVDHLVEEADDALYRAKELGKNRVEVTRMQAEPAP